MTASLTKRFSVIIRDDEHRLSQVISGFATREEAAAAQRAVKEVNARQGRRVFVYIDETHQIS